MKTYKTIGLLLFSTSFAFAQSQIEGVNPSTVSNDFAIRGTISSTAPGSFSAGLRGTNNGTGGLGIGVYGSHNGSGWGVYGVTPNGFGLYGNASSGGFGVYGNSNTGIGIYATSTNGIPFQATNSNSSNANNVAYFSNIGSGTVLRSESSAYGTAIFGSSRGFGIHGVTSEQSSAGVYGINPTGEAVVGISSSNIGGAVVGRNDGEGYGVHGFSATNTSGASIGVYGRAGILGGKGRAGRFQNFSATNTDANTLEVESNGDGNTIDFTKGNVASFLSNNTRSVSAGVRAEINTMFGNFGAASVFGVASGTGGYAGLFHASHATGDGKGLVVIAEGNGNAIMANAGNAANGVETSVDGTGNSLYSFVPSFATGRAGRFENFNADNTKELITAKTVGSGNAISAIVDKNTGTSAAIKGEVNSIFANFGTAGIYGLSSGTGGCGGLFYASNANGNGPALVASSEGNGDGIVASTKKGGTAVEASASGTGYAVFASIPNFATGQAGRFANYNVSNTKAALSVSTNATGGNVMLVNHTGGGSSGDLQIWQSVGTNTARINKAGRGFFNGGTQTGGADIAEAFDTEGMLANYEEGDVLAISELSDRTVTKSSGPYSFLVAGVYATKPGVLLTEDDIETDISHKVPMGVVGVIPTKVCLEGGEIKRGDLLVTSSLEGVAMKADLNKVRVGQVIGKALQGFNSQTVQKINVLVNVK